MFSYFRDDIVRVLIVTFSILIFSDYPQSVQKATSYTSVDFSNTKCCLRVGRFRGKLHEPKCFIFISKSQRAACINIRAMSS